MAEELSRLNHDLLSRILARVDGPTLAAVSSVNRELHGVAEEESLWQRLTHETWPSTKDEVARRLISSLGGFARFYGDSFPLIVYRPMGEEGAFPCRREQGIHLNPSPSDFISFVDVFYEDKCVFSKVLCGIPGADEYDQDDRRTSWFSRCPFRVDLLQQQRRNRNNDDGNRGYDTDDDDDVAAVDEEEDETGILFPSVHFAHKKERGGQKLWKKLEEKVRLSWVLVNKRSGRAVNLSSWKPLIVQRHWPAEGDIWMKFGCPVAAAAATSGPAECVVSVKCRLLESESRLKWRSISMRVEDRDGRHLDGGTALFMLEGASRCRSRSREWSLFERGYGEYAREKEEMTEKKMRSEGIAERLCVFAGIAVFSSLCYLGHSILLG